MEMDGKSMKIPCSVEIQGICHAEIIRCQGDRREHVSAMLEELENGEISAVEGWIPKNWETPGIRASHQSSCVTKKYSALFFALHLHSRLLLFFCPFQN